MLLQIILNKTVYQIKLKKIKLVFFNYLKQYQTALDGLANISCECRSKKCIANIIQKKFVNLRKFTVNYTVNYKNFNLQKN